MSHRAGPPDSPARDSRRLMRRHSRVRTLAVNGVVAVVVLVVALTWLAMRGSNTPEDSLPEPTVIQEPVEPAESAPPVVGVLTADDAWLPGWRVVAGEESATVAPSLVCGATETAGPLSGPTQTLTNGSASIRVHALTDARDPSNAFKAIYAHCRGTNPGIAGPTPIWTAPDADGKRVRSSYALWPAKGAPRAILLVTVIDEGTSGGGRVELSNVVNDLWYAVDGSPRPARSAGAPATS